MSESKRTHDVLIAEHVRPGPTKTDVDELSRFKDAVKIGPNLSVECLYDANKIMDACEPVELGRKSTRIFGCYYAIVNDNPSNPDDDNWDPEQTLVRVVAFSRIIHSNPAGLTYAARVRRSQSNELIEVVPARASARAYVANMGRAYLTADEWKKVGDLLNRWKASVAHASERINTSLWLFEKSAREHDVEARWPLTVAAVEALAHGVEKNGCKSRFKRLLSGLGKSSRDEFTEKESDAAWDCRCTLVHGGRPEPVTQERATELARLLARVERSLGSFLGVLIKDDSFASRFDSEDKIVAWLGS